MMDKRLLALVPEALRHVLATVAWQWVGLVGNVALVWVIARVASSLVAGVAVPQVAWPLLAAGIVLRVVAARMAARESFAASQDVKRVLRRRIYEKLLAMGPGYTDQVPTAEVVQLSVEGCEQLETYFGQYLPQLFYAVLAPVTLFAVVAPVSLPAAAVLLLCVPLIPATIVAVQKVAKRILGKYWDQYAELGDSFLENLQGLTTLKIYRADAARHEAMNQEAERFRTITMKVLSMQLNSIIVMDIVALGGAVAGIAVALFATASGAIDLFGCLFVVLISADFFLPMRQLGSYFHVAMNGMAASEKIFRLLDLSEPPARTLEPKVGDAFCLRDVTFGYVPEREVLHGVSLKVAPRGMTAIVGESGSGKSTIAALLCGHLPGYVGETLLGAAQVRDLDPAALARYVTYVGLGARLFAGTVRDNLLMAAPCASEEELWAALKTANLSGGQRQRLALARAVLHETPVYVFDEATSNVDVESEETIMAAVRNLAATHAVVLISHRLANVTDAQRIYVMERGHVAGEGTHEELLVGCPEYASLWRTQSELENVTKGQSLCQPQEVTADAGQE